MVVCCLAQGAITIPLILTSAVVALLGMFVYSRGLSFVLMFISYSCAVILGVFIGFRYVFTRGKKYQSSLKKREENALLKLLLEKQQNSSSPSKKQHVIVTRSVDSALEEIIDLITRDYIMYWLNDLISNSQKLSDMIKEDAWIVIQNAHDTLGKIDQVKFLTNDVTNKICQHYQKIRLASIGGDGKEAKPLFLLRSYLESQETEIEFLRKVSEALLVLLLPKSYNQFEPVRHLLREIFACSVLFPIIELICDPDYINQKLLSYIQYHQEMLERHKRTYAVAATYEDFIKMLNECTDIEQLKRMRYKIMSEIMQATTLKNLKKAKGMDVDKEFMPQGGHKGDFLQARNLKRYINQLTMCKIQCEKKIKCLGGPDFTSPLSPTSSVPEEIPNIPGKRVLSLQVILDSPHARRFFMKFLQKENTQALLGCWELLEEMRLADKKNIHQIGNEIHKTYIQNASNVVKLDKAIVKGMEAFLVGDKGPEAFLSAQEAIAHNLEERHYPCFIVSDVYHKMLKEADELGIDFLNEPLDETDGSSFEISSECSSDGSIPLSDHSSYAKSKLQQLDERLNNKIQALKGMKAAQNLDSKVTMKLEKEVESMKQERSQLEYHIDRTEVWSENLGKWRVQIQNSKVVSEKDKLFPSFTLAVHQSGEIATEFDELTTMRWNVTKKLNDFMDLHRKLIQIGPWLKSAELPKEGKMLFKNYDKPYLEKAKGLIQNYMNLILEDEQLNKNENLYTFLSPNPEFLKQPVPSSKKTKFFLANLFKGQNSGPKEGSDDEEFLFLDDEIGPMKDDPIAEPLYALIGEIFDMRGVFKLLRRTLITFVQMTYGRTINRQLRDTVSWIFSEPMILHYIHLFQDAMWPNGVLAKPGPIRDDEIKIHTRHQAKELFLSSIPALLSDLVGQQNARKGALKVFESLQDVRLNKQLLYELFELFLQEIFADYKDRSI